MQLLYVIIVYLVYLLLWGVVCTLAYSLTLIFKRKSILEWFVGIATLVAHIINFVIGIWLLIYTFSLLFDGQILWFLAMIFFGIGLVAQVFSILQLPFFAIPAYYSHKIEHTNMDEDIVIGEIIDENNKVVGTTEEGTFSKSRRLALYFSIAYLLNLFSLYLSQEDYPGYKWGDYILTPFLWLFSQVIFLGIFVGIINKLKRQKFFHNGFKSTLTTILKVSNYIMGAFTIIFLLLGIW